MITVDYNIQMEDLLAFQKDMFKNSVELKKSIRAYRLIIPAFAFLLWLYDFILNGFSVEIFGLTFISSLIWIFLSPMIYKKGSLKKVRKIFEEGPNRTLIGDYRLIADDKELTFHTPHATSVVQWSGVEKWTESKDHLFLYHSPSSAFIIAKHKVQNTEDLTKFKELLEAKKRLI